MDEKLIDMSDLNLAAAAAPRPVPEPVPVPTLAPAVPAAAAPSPFIDMSDLGFGPKPGAPALAPPEPTKDFIDMSDLGFGSKTAPPPITPAKDMATGERLGRHFVSGALGTAEGMGGALQWVTGGALGKDFSDFMGQVRKEVTPAGEASFIDQLASGAGSMATFFIPGFGAARGASLAGRLAPKAAQWLGAGTMAVTEAATEAGQVYRDELEKGKGEGKAGTAANWTFWLNLPVLTLTDKLAFFGNEGKALSRALRGMVTEGSQESLQEVISTWSQEEQQNLKNILTSGAVGALLGGGVGAIAKPIGEAPTPGAQETVPPAGAPPVLPPGARPGVVPEPGTEATPAVAVEPGPEPLPSAPPEVEVPPEVVAAPPSPVIPPPVPEVTGFEVTKTRKGWSVAGMDFTNQADAEAFAAKAAAAATETPPPVVTPEEAPRRATPPIGAGVVGVDVAPETVPVEEKPVLKTPETSEIVPTESKTVPETEKPVPETPKTPDQPLDVSGTATQAVATETKKAPEAPFKMPTAEVLAGMSDADLEALAEQVKAAGVDVEMLGTGAYTVEEPGPGDPFLERLKALRQEALSKVPGAAAVPTSALSAEPVQAQPFNEYIQTGVPGARAVAPAVTAPTLPPNAWKLPRNEYLQEGLKGAKGLPAKAKAEFTRSLLAEHERSVEEQMQLQNPELGFEQIGDYPKLAEKYFPEPGTETPTPVPVHEMDFDTFKEALIRGQLADNPDVVMAPPSPEYLAAQDELFTPPGGPGKQAVPIRQMESFMPDQVSKFEAIKAKEIDRWAEETYKLTKANAPESAPKPAESAQPTPLPPFEDIPVQTRDEKITSHERIVGQTKINAVTYSKFTDMVKTQNWPEVQKELYLSSANFTRDAFDHHFNPLNLMARLVESGVPRAEAKALVKEYETQAFKPVREALGGKKAPEPKALSPEMEAVAAFNQKYGGAARVGIPEAPQGVDLTGLAPDIDPVATGFLPATKSPTSLPTYKNFPTERLELVPDIFQHKREADPLTGGGLSLTDIEKYDQTAAGNISVFETKDGRFLVSNGHQRTNAAKRLNEPTVGIQVRREVDGWTQQEVRVASALENLKGGTVDALDIGSYLRETGLTAEDLAAKGVSLTKGEVQKGIGLSGLPDRIWVDVYRGVWGHHGDAQAVEKGAALGALRENAAAQEAIYKRLMELQSEGKDISLPAIRNLVDAGRVAIVTEGQQQGLFGDEEVVNSRIFERAALVTYIQKELTTDKNAHLAANRERDRLEAAGNVIDAKANKAIAEKAKGVLGVFGRASKVGWTETSRVLNEFAERYAQAKSTGEENALKKEALTEIHSALEADYEAIGRADLGPATGRVGPGKKSGQYGSEGVSGAPQEVAEPTSTYGRPLSKFEKRLNGIISQYPNADPERVAQALRAAPKSSDRELAGLAAMKPGEASGVVRGTLTGMERQEAARRAGVPGAALFPEMGMGGGGLFDQAPEPPRVPAGARPAEVAPTRAPQEEVPPAYYTRPGSSNDYAKGLWGMVAHPGGQAEAKEMAQRMGGQDPKNEYRARVDEIGQWIVEKKKPVQTPVLEINPENVDLHRTARGKRPLDSVVGLDKDGRNIFAWRQSGNVMQGRLPSWVVEVEGRPDLKRRISAEDRAREYAASLIDHDQSVSEEVLSEEKFRPKDEFAHLKTSPDETTGKVGDRTLKQEALFEEQAPYVLNAPESALSVKESTPEERQGWVAPGEPKPERQPLPAGIGGRIASENPEIKYLTRKTRLAQTPDGQKVEKMHEGAEAQWKELRSWRKKEYWQEAKRLAIDVSANLKKALLKKAGARGQEAIMRHDLVAGASSKAKMLFDEASKEIYGGLKKTEEILLNRMIESERIIAIEAYRPELKHPGMLGAADHQAYLADLQQADPDLYGKLKPRAEAYFAATKDALNALRDAGLINQEAYKAMANHAYAPREFIQHVDPDVTGFTAGGKKISVPDSGIKRLEEGSDQALNHNYRDLLSQVIGRTHARIMKNEANLALHDMAQADKDNGLVRLASPKEKLGTHETAIHVMVNGQPVKMIMPDVYAREWVQSDPLIAAQLSNFVGWVSGAKVLRAAATGMNPGFALTNLPRDIAHIWMTDAKQAYSPYLPKYLAQIGKDLLAVLPDAIGRKGAWKSYINEGGGMDWLTSQGQVGERLSGVFGNIQRYLGWIGETSEILTRLAIRNRNLKNGATPIEATWAARNYLDFSQGGSFTKALDSGLPYLNASIQGTRMIAKAAHSDPKLFALKVGQIGALAIGLYLANSLINPDAWDEIPENEKVTNWIITTPFSYLDEMGNKRYHYFRIAKDQGQRVFASAFEGLAALLRGAKVDGGQITSAMGDFLPLIPNEKLPPTFQAMLGYLANKDFWRNRDIWRGPQVEAQEEFNKLTNPVMVKAGAATGLSPERLGYALSSVIPSTNTYVALVGGGLKAMLSDLPAKDRERTLGEIIAQVPMMNKILRATDPNVPYMKEIEESTIKESTARLKQRREVEKIVDANIELTLSERRDAYRKYIGAQPPEATKRLVRQIKNYEAYHDLPDRRWWLSLSHLTPEVRAESFYKRYKSSSEDKKEELRTLGVKLPGINSLAFRERLQQLDSDLDIPLTADSAAVDKELNKLPGIGVGPIKKRKPGRYSALGFQ